MPADHALLERVREALHFGSSLVDTRARPVVIHPIAHALRRSGATAAGERVPVVPVLVLLQLQRHIVLQRELADRGAVTVQHRQMRALLPQPVRSPLGLEGRCTIEVSGRQPELLLLHLQPCEHLRWILRIACEGALGRERIPLLLRAGRPRGTGRGVGLPPVRRLDKGFPAGPWDDGLGSLCAVRIVLGADVLGTHRDVIVIKLPHRLCGIRKRVTAPVAISVLLQTDERARVG